MAQILQFTNIYTVYAVLGMPRQSCNIIYIQKKNMQ
jgi:hypothetical protein